jgi:hypothetical protein
MLRFPNPTKSLELLIGMTPQPMLQLLGMSDKDFPPPTDDQVVKLMAHPRSTLLAMSMRRMRRVSVW